MKNKISPPSHSLSKRNCKQIKIYSDPKRSNNFSTNKSFIKNLTEICNNIYEDNFPNILKITKTNFFESFNKEVDEIFLQGKYKNSENIKKVIEAKENMMKKYDNDFKFLSEEYQNFLKNRKNYKYLTHYRKHCGDTDYYALHYCSSKKKGKFIEIRNKYTKKREVLYVICDGCKQCYYSKFILMLCNHCNKKYYSNTLKENEDGNLLPATWKKYHCNSLINEIMKCIKCKSILYINLSTKQLVCLNKRCNFSSKDESLLWTCNICSKEFRSQAKIYNPLEFQILKKSINYALLKQIRAAPKELPCRCTKDISKLIFYHKEECRGELYKGMLIDRPMLVCSRCKAINFEEKFTWICPRCSVKFHLHRVRMMGGKPFSKKKYIINRNCNQSARNIPKRKIDKENLFNNILIYNKKNNILTKSVNNSHMSNHSKLLPSDDLNNISTFNTNNHYENSGSEKYFKRVELNKARTSKSNENEKNDINENNRVYDHKKKCWIVINLKKPKNNLNTNDTDPLVQRRKKYTTLLEILQQRMHSQSNKSNNCIKNNNFNKTIQPRIKNYTLVKRKKDLILEPNKIINATKENHSTRHNKIIQLKKEDFQDKEEKKEKEKEKGKEEKKEKEKEKDKKKEKKGLQVLKSKILDNILKHSDSKKNENPHHLRLKYSKKQTSPFKSGISLRKFNYLGNNKKQSMDNKKNENDIKKISLQQLDLSSNRNNIQNKNGIKEKKNLYISTRSKNNNYNINNSINSFRFWKNKSHLTGTITNTSNENKINYKNRIFKRNDLFTSNKFETESSLQDNNYNLMDSKNKINISNNSSFRLSFLGNSTINNTTNDHNNNKDNYDNMVHTIRRENNNNNINILSSDTIKDIKDGKKKESEEESHYTEENYDKIEDLKALLRKNVKSEEKPRKEKKEKKDKIFNDSDLYEEKEDSSNEADVDEEKKDIVKDVVINFSAKKNFRESLILKTNLNRQSILISQDKLNGLAKNTNIPSINESDYNYIKPIGEGTYGAVYLVEHNKTFEQFALKKIICRDYNELIKQKSELELIFSVKHEHILKLYGMQLKFLDETTSAIYVLMELAQNDWNTEIKRRILAKRHYKEIELINMLKQIIKGFLFLQDKNIAHRDIKPQNILLFPNNVYKIADFGEAKFIKNIAEQSTLRGSELFMSPLLYKGYKFNQKNVLHNPFKSDVFSLGYCLLYAMCLNLKVLEVVRDLSSMKTIKNNINKYIAQKNYSEKLINLIYKMVEPDEDLRCDFEDLSVELQKL